MLLVTKIQPMHKCCWKCLISAEILQLIDHFPSLRVEHISVVFQKPSTCTDAGRFKLIVSFVSASEIEPFLTFAANQWNPSCRLLLPANRTRCALRCCWSI